MPNAPRIRLQCVTVVLVLACCAACPRPAAPADSPNLVVNGDFSKVENGKPANWETSGNPKTVAQSLDVFDDGGNPCARLMCTRFDGKASGWDHAMLAQVGGVKLEKDQVYEFSCRVRAENLASRNIAVTIQDMDGWHPCGLRTELPLTRSWQTHKRVFKAARSADKSTRLQFWFTETGTLYLDDVRIVKLSGQKVEFTQVVPDAGSKNLVPNGSFESGAAGWSSLGTGAGWGNMPGLHGDIEERDAAHGRRFLRIPLGGHKTPVLSFDYYEPVSKPQLRVLASNLGWIPVRAGEPYTVSCSMRANIDGTPAMLGLRTRDPERGRGTTRDLRQQVRLTTSWKRYSFTCRPTGSFVFVTIGPDLSADARVDVDIDAVQLEKGAAATQFEPRLPLELAIEPSAPAGIFTDGERASLRIRASNTAAATAKVQVEFQATDFFDSAAAIPPLELNVPAGDTAAADVPLPADWRGYYKVIARWKVGSLVESQEVRLAFVPPRAETDSVLGINHAFNTPFLIRLAAKAGVAWYRDWSLKWDHIEPSPGQYRWELADVQIDRVRKEGARVLPLLPPFPSANWNSEAPDGIPTKGYPGERLRAAWAPKEPDKLGQFAALAVARYKDRVSYWEFLNEPIYTTYALPRKGTESLKQYGGPRYEPADYVRLLAVAAAGMKKSDPACKVIGGIGAGPETYTKEVIEAGCLKHLDIFNLHTYPGTASPEGFLHHMDKLLKLMDDNGGRKPIWVTEFSYYGTDTLPRAPFFPDSGSWAEERLLASERECAEFTIRFFALMMARGVEKIFIHSGASGSVNDAELECCLFAYGGLPRKVFPALAVYTELMGPRPKAAGEKLFGEAGHCFAFETGKRSVLVLWTAAPEPLAVAVPDGAVCLDLMGRKVPGQTVPLSSTPAYLVGPPGKAKDLLQSLDSATGGR